MRTLSDHAVLEDLVNRLRRLAPTQPGLWGSMKAQQMVLHVGDASAAVLKQAAFAATPRRGPPRSPMRSSSATRFLGP